jgi:hypothetical protein
MVVAQLNLNRDEITGAVEQGIDECFLQGEEGLRRFLDPRSELQTLLWRRLAETSRRVVLACLNGIVCQFLTEPPADRGQPDRLSFVDLLHEALPKRTRRPEGGGVKQLLIVPANLDVPAFQQQIAAVLPNVTVMGGLTCDVTLCTVHGETPLDKVAREVIHGIEGYETLASRLHSRTDVPWSPLAKTAPATGQAAKDIAGPTKSLPAAAAPARRSPPR